MKLRTISAAAIALVSGLLLSNSHIGRVHADEKACSTKTLHGSYGFYRSGTTTSTGPLTAVGIGFYDGNGNVTATQTISRNESSLLIRQPSVSTRWMRIVPAGDS